MSVLNSRVVLHKNFLKCFTKLLSTSVNSPATLPQTNDKINPFVYNRNPRNLERLRLARKPTGYCLEKNSVEFWHKLLFEETNKYITVKIISNNNVEVVVASTKEKAMTQFLVKSKDTVAYLNLARVFAERCLESGINECYCDITPQKDSKIEAFLNVLEQEGLSLTESKYYDIYETWSQKLEKKPWTVLEPQ